MANSLTVYTKDYIDSNFTRSKDGFNGFYFVSGIDIDGSDLNVDYVDPADWSEKTSTLTLPSSSGGITGLTTKIITDRNTSCASKTSWTCLGTNYAVSGGTYGAMVNIRMRAAGQDARVGLYSSSSGMNENYSICVIRNQNSKSGDWYSTSCFIPPNSTQYIYGMLATYISVTQYQFKA